MAKLDTQKELDIRAELGLEMAVVTELGVILTEFLTFNGVEQFTSYINLFQPSDTTDELKSTRIDNLLVKYAMLYCTNLTDSAVAGAENCPNVFIDYRVEVFQQHNVKDDNVSSHDVFIDTMIKFHNKFLVNRNVAGVAGVKRSALTSLQPFQHNIESLRVPGRYGSSALFGIRVEVR